MNKGNANRSFSLQTLRMIHIVLCVGVSFFGLFMGFQLSDSQISIDYFVIGLAIFSFFLVLVGYRIYTNKISSIDENKSLSEKLNNFQIACIIRYTSIEAPVIIGIIFSFLFENIAFLIISLFLIFLLISLHPTKSKIETALNLNPKEKEQLRHLK